MGPGTAVFLTQPVEGLDPDAIYYFAGLAPEPNFFISRQKDLSDPLIEVPADCIAPFIKEN